MLRIIYLSDTHIMSDTPKNRKDNFLDTVSRKLREVAGLCRDLQVDCVIHGGDVFDQPHPGQASLELMHRFLEELFIPFYCVAGNHDLVNQQLGSMQMAALSSLAGNRKHNFILLQPGEKTYLGDGNCVIQLSGQHFYAGIDRSNSGAAYMVKKAACDLAIHVVHGMLLPRAFSEQVACTLISDIASTEADFTLGAHAHLGYEVELSGKYFINPGALVRVTNLARETTRRPQVLLLEITNRPSYRFISLKTALPASDVLNMECF